MKTQLIAIDPGVHKSGFAFYYAGGLSAGYGDNEGLIATVAGSELVIELPQVYTAARSKGDPEDLVQLARVVGRFEQAAKARGLAVRIVRPREWKGSVRKEVFTRRILDYLAGYPIGYEIAKLPESTRHNAIDALGLWLYGNGVNLLNGYSPQEFRAGAK